MMFAMGSVSIHRIPLMKYNRAPTEPVTTIAAAYQGALRDGASIFASVVLSLPAPDTTRTNSSTFAWRRLLAGAAGALTLTGAASGAAMLCEVTRSRASAMAAFFICVETGRLSGWRYRPAISSSAIRRLSPDASGSARTSARSHTPKSRTSFAARPSIAGSTGARDARPPEIRMLRDSSTPYANLRWCIKAISLAISAAISTTWSTRSACRAIRSARDSPFNSGRSSSSRLGVTVFVLSVALAHRLPSLNQVRIAAPRQHRPAPAGHALQVFVKPRSGRPLKELVFEESERAESRSETVALLQTTEPQQSIHFPGRMSARMNPVPHMRLLAYPILERRP